MVAVPVATAVTNPVVTPIVATAVLSLVHVPPVVLLLSVVVAPVHIAVVPVIGPGAAVTVIVAVTLQDVPSE